MISTTRNEAKYQMIKLVKSGRTITEAKAILRATAMGLDAEYASKKDVDDLGEIEGGIHRLLMTRGDAQKVARVKFTPRKQFAMTKEEHLARWATNYGGQGKIGWARDGNLVRRGPPNKPRPGSSKGKVGKTRVIGAKRVLKDFRFLVSTLKQLIAKGGTANTKELQKAYKSVRTAVTAKGGKT
jgi:hypothetical protein